MDIVHRQKAFCVPDTHRFQLCSGVLRVLGFFQQIQGKNRKLPLQNRATNLEGECSINGVHVHCCQS
jgi:hypothetical protein